MWVEKLLDLGFEKITPTPPWSIFPQRWFLMGASIYTGVEHFQQIKTKSVYKIFHDLYSDDDHGVGVVDDNAPFALL